MFLKGVDTYEETTLVSTLFPFQRGNNEETTWKQQRNNDETRRKRRGNKRWRKRQLNAILHQIKNKIDVKLFINHQSQQ